MRPVQQMTNAGVTGPGVWVPIDYMQKAFAIGFRCTLGGTASPSATYKIQHAFESTVQDTLFTLTRSSTTATLTFTSPYALNNIDAWVSHGLAVTTTEVEVSGCGAPFDGVYPVASVTNNRTVTYTVAASGLTVANAGGRIQRLYVGDHPIIVGVTGSTDGNYAYPPNRVRVNITTFGSGAITLSLNQGI